MGKIYDSLLSGTSGRTGRIVVANMFGHEFSKIRPRKRTSPPTAKQQLIHHRMRKSALFMESYRGYACDHYGRRVGMKSCYNLAMTNLMTNFVIDFVAGTITPQYPSISFSRGPLLAAVPLNITLPTPDTITVTWQDNSAGHPLRETDWAQILIAAKDEPLTSFVENAAQRTAGTYSQRTGTDGRQRALCMARLPQHGRRHGLQFRLRRNHYLIPKSTDPQPVLFTFQYRCNALRLLSPSPFPSPS